MSNIKIQARNNLHRRVSEFLSEGNGVKNMISLLKDKFTAEGFENPPLMKNLPILRLQYITKIRAFSLHYSLKGANI